MMGVFVIVAVLALAPLVGTSAFDVGKIDDVIHGRLRLGIMAYLVSNEVADFTELKNALEDAGYVAIEKSFLNRKPLTRVRVTDLGRKAFRDYLDVMAKLVGPPPKAS
jgi:hypothetical protein